MEPYYRAIFENTGTAMLIYGDDGRILLLNSELERLCGCSRDKIEKLDSLKEIFHDDSWERLKHCDQMLALQLERVPLRIEGKIRGQQGQDKYVLITLAPIPDNKHRVASMIDITESKRLREEIMRLDQLNLVGEIAASIGHEVRNPITSIRGFLQIMRENIQYAEEWEYFDLMLEEIDRVNAIITEYLLMARTKKPELQPKSINHILQSLFPLLNADARRQDKNLCMELEDIPVLMLDEQEIRQLVFNLVRNGLESMPDNETLTIRTQQSCDQVILEVIDRGGGIPDEIIDHIGVPFFTTKENGTGLGLPVCYNIAAQHQASIQVDSSHNGTCFRVCFAAGDGAAPIG